MLVLFAQLAMPRRNPAPRKRSRTPPLTQVQRTPSSASGGKREEEARHPVRSASDVVREMDFDIHQALPLRVGGSDSDHARRSVVPVKRLVPAVKGFDDYVARPLASQIRRVAPWKMRIDAMHHDRFPQLAAVAAAAQSTERMAVSPQAGYALPAPLLELTDPRFRYVADCEDVKWCNMHDVPALALQEIFTLLERTHAKLFLARCAGASPFARVFQERNAADGQGRASACRSREAGQTLPRCDACSEPLAVDPLTCRRCHAAAHRTCWFPPPHTTAVEFSKKQRGTPQSTTPSSFDERDAAFTCEPCQAKARVATKCVACWRDGGAMLRVTSTAPRRRGQATGQTVATGAPLVDGSAWVHIACARLLENTTFDKAQRTVQLGRFELRRDVHCSLCRSPNGLCVSCDHDDCGAAFHPSCAAGSGVADFHADADGAMQYRVFCAAHVAIRDGRALVAADRHTILRSATADCDRDVRAHVDDVPRKCRKYIAELTAQWQQKRRARHAANDNIVQNMAADADGKISALLRPELIRLESGGMVLSAALYLVPALQLFLSRRLEHHLWAETMWAGIERKLGLRSDTPRAAGGGGAPVPPDCDLKGAEAPPSSDVAKQLRVMSDMAVAAVTLNALAGNVLHREEAKRDLLELDIQELDVEEHRMASSRGSYL
jgi:hypothetical protein